MTTNKPTAGDMSDKARMIIMHDFESVRSVLISEQQWQVLQLILECGEIRSSEISECCGFKPSHTSMITAALFEKGYVTRTGGGSKNGGYAYRIKSSLFEPVLLDA